MTTVVDVRKSAYDVYIGRPTRAYPQGSPWGNPFRIPRDGNRDQVIAKYREWVLHSHSVKANWIRQHVHELRGKRLGCWCRPPEGFQGRLMCHGQILAGLADGIPPESVE